MNGDFLLGLRITYSLPTAVAWRLTPGRTSISMVRKSRLSYLQKNTEQIYP
jgi:hypothetical protein